LLLYLTEIFQKRKIHIIVFFNNHYSVYNSIETILKKNEEDKTDGLRKQSDLGMLAPIEKKKDNLFFFFLL